MSLNVSASGESDYEIAPEGVYTARCFKIIDLGTQWVEWKGDKKQQRKVLITWELFGTHDTDQKDEDDNIIAKAGTPILMHDGRPWSVTKKYTATLDERGRLRPDLEAWRGQKFTDKELEEFDLKNVLGAFCTIQVIHSEDGKYANVNSIMAKKFAKDADGKYIDKPKPVNPDVAFDIDKPDMAVFELFSNKMKEQIQASAEWQARGKTQNRPGDDNADNLGDEPINLDDIPF